MDKKNYILVCVVVLAVCFLVLFFTKTLLFDEQGPFKKIDRPIRNFDLDIVYPIGQLDPSEQRIHLADFKGKKIILNFWATWCESCKDEAKIIERFWKENRDRNIIVLGIAVDSKVDDVQRFGSFFGKSYQLAIDKTGEISVEFGVTGVPETYYIDENGIIKNKYIGPITSAGLESLQNLR